MAPAAVWLAGGTLAAVPNEDGWLHVAERRWLARLTMPKRRADWRLGRHVMKRLLAARLPGHPRLARIAVLPDADGAPCAFLDGVPLPIHLSISHRAGVALCAASALLVPGCDVEIVEPRSAAFVDDWFTPAERALVRAVGAARRPLVANLVWSCKESAAKALHAGLRLDTRDLDVRAEVAAPGEWGRVTVVHDGTELRGRWRRAGDLLLTMVARDARGSDADAPEPRVILLEPAALRGGRDQNVTPTVIGMSCSLLPPRM